MSDVDVTDLAFDLAERGFAEREMDVRRIVRAARATGIPATLTDVLADRAQPEVARLRAFGHVAARLAASGTGPALTVDAA